MEMNGVRDDRVGNEASLQKEAEGICAVNGGKEKGGLDKDEMKMPISFSFFAEVKRILLNTVKILDQREKVIREMWSRNR